MITKLDIMLDPETYDGEYVGDVRKVAVSDTSVQFSLDFPFDGRTEQIIAEISFTKNLNRTTKMLRECGVKKIDELKSAKRVSFNIHDGWVNITGFGDTAGGASSSESAADTSKFLK